MTIKRVDNFLSAIDFPVWEVHDCRRTELKLATLENEML